MNDATKAKFAEILRQQQEAAAKATAKKTGQPQAPKQATAAPTPPPVPQPAAPVNTSPLDEYKQRNSINTVPTWEPGKKYTLKSFFIEWHEGTGEYDGQTFTTWKEANKAMTEICRAHGYEQGYSKVKIRVTWENGAEILDRADCGKNSNGDFSSDRETIGQYLSRQKSCMYSSNLNVGDRASLMFEDAAEAAAGPELSSLTINDLLTPQKVNTAAPAPVYCQPQPFTLPATTSQPSARIAVQKAPAAQPATDAPGHGLILVTYSPKSFAVFGKTKENAEALYNLGGKLNYYLKFNGKQTPGFIFSNRHLEKVRQHFGL